MSNTPLTDAVIDELCPYLESKISMRLEKHAKQLERALAAKTVECERLREAGARHRWRLSYISENINDNTAIRFALMASNEEIDAARKETP